MNTETTPAASRPVPPLIWVLVVVGFAFALYQSARWGIRQYVDSRIEGAVGGKVVDFDLETTTGDRLVASEFRGRWLILNFFRSQCPSCIAERPAIHELASRIDPGAGAVVGVLVDRVQGYTAEQSAATLARLDYDHPVVWADADFVDAFHGHGWANVTPITYLVAPDGTVASSLRGHHDFATIVAALPDGVVR